MTNITGAKFLAQSVREQIAAAKGSINAATAEIGEGVAAINGAAAEGKKIGQALKAEASELLSEIGQLSNMPPEGPY